MKTQILTASLATLLFAAPALAADPIVPVAPAPAPVASAFAWDGFYAGVNAGYGWGEAYDDDGVIDLAGDEFDSIDGWLGGAQAGYNYDFGGFVLGVEGDIQLTDMSQTIDPVAIDLDYFGTVRARLGAPVGDALAYVTGGLAFGDATIENTVTGDTDSNFHVGWTIGAGLEYAVSEAISVKGEYLYTDLGQRTYGLPGQPDQDAGVRFHTARVGLNFHF